MPIAVVNKLWGRTMALTMWPFIIMRRDSVTHTNMNHEMIHIEQQKELLVVFAIIWYVVEFLVKSIKYRSFEKGYRNISFEREAYENEVNLDYLDKRKRYAFLKYVNVRQEQ